MTRAADAAGILVTGGALDPLLPHIDAAASKADAIDIVVAFAKNSGVGVIASTLRAALLRGASVRILTGDYLTITDESALGALMLLSDAESSGDEERLSSSGGERPDDMRVALELKVVEVAKLPSPTTSFHPKAWIFRRRDRGGEAFVGSSNLSRAALETAIEWNIKVSERETPERFQAIVTAFDALWHRATAVTPVWLAEYRKRSREHAVAYAPMLGEPVEQPPEPHAAQREALATLRSARETGRTRALVVLATGLGKTLLAAFDVEQFRETLGRPPRVLFIAHRIELLRQASLAFESIARSRGRNADIGWFAGELSDIESEIVFASVHKLSRDKSLAELREQSFDYVVIDEVHHAAAESYQKILSALRACFVLGLTATPDRLDEKSVIELFGGEIAFRANIARGIELGRLVPFAYFGLADDIDYRQFPQRRGSFVLEDVALAASSDPRMTALWTAWQEHPARRTLLFCCTQKHTLFVRDWLRAKGVRVNAVFAGRGSDDRAESLREFREENGGLDALCVVDLFNEGLDVPSVDRVAMLRPTESPVIFLQQLGRGLRAAGPGKSRLVVIDFVGNHTIFADRLRALLAEVSAATDSTDLVARAVSRETDAPLEASGCTVSLALEAKDILRAILRAERALPEELAGERALEMANRVIDKLWNRPNEQRRLTGADGATATLARRDGGLWIDIETGARFISANAIAWAWEVTMRKPAARPADVVYEQFPWLRDEEMRSDEIPRDRLDTASWALEMVRAAGNLSEVVPGGRDLKLRDDDGREMDATFSVERDERGLSAVFESRGAGRNSDYGAALEKLLSRMARAGIGVREVSVASRESRAQTGGEIKLDLSAEVLGVEDPKKARKAIGSAAARSGRKEGAKGAGNATKRLRIALQFDEEPRSDGDVIAILRGPAKG